MGTGTYRWELTDCSSEYEGDTASYLNDGWEPFAIQSWESGPAVFHFRRLVRLVCAGCGLDVGVGAGPRKRGVG